MLSLHVAIISVHVRRFDREDLCQLQNIKALNVCCGHVIDGPSPSGPVLQVTISCILAYTCTVCLFMVYMVPVMLLH